MTFLNANQIDLNIYHTFIESGKQPRIARQKTVDEIKQELIDLARSQIIEEQLNKSFRHEILKTC